MLADSEYRHELEAAINPFKGLLLGLFFITVGAGLDRHGPHAEIERQLPHRNFAFEIDGCVTFVVPFALKPS